jgi:hypothetical protein
MHEELSGPGVIEWLGFRYKTILPAAEAGGTMSIVDSLSPAGSGPPRHVHVMRLTSWLSNSSVVGSAQ